MKLRTCIICGGPRRSLTHEVCSRCRPTKNHEHDICPRCGGSKLKITSICIKCHARDANVIAASNRRGKGKGRKDTCPVCGSPKMREAKTCHKCFNKIRLKNNPPITETVTKDGRVRIYVPGRGRIYRAHLVIEESLGFHIPRGHQVHHLNHKPDDDRIENLALVTRSAHLRIHRREVIPVIPSHEILSAAGKKGAAARWHPSL